MDRAFPSAAAVPARIGQRAFPAVLLVLVFELLVIALNPVGYVGGGGDDWQYLAAARCWAAEGICLPHDHWSARWPLIAPMGAAIALFGESRAALMIVPSFYSLAALLLLTHLAERLFGRGPALIAGGALVLTPIFAVSMARPSVDMVELAFLAAAATAALACARSGKRRHAFLAGGALGIAALTRETSFVYALVALLGLAAAPSRARFLWAAPGFALPIAAEMAAYWAATGDPFRRAALALGHTRIPSTELAAYVDTSRSPLFNPDFIAGWKLSNGIDIHWALNPLANLFTHPHVGLTLSAALLLLLAAARHPEEAERTRKSALLVAAAGLASLLLIYALAIDPKPRMFLPLAAGAAVAIGASAGPAWRSLPRLPLAAAGLLIAARSVLVIATAPNIAGAEAEARNWIESRPNVSIDETTRRHLALVPRARSLPAEGPPQRLTLGWGGCASLAAPGERIEREYRLSDSEPILAALARRAGVALGEGESHSLCLFGPARPA